MEGLHVALTLLSCASCGEPRLEESTARELLAAQPGNSGTLRCNWERNVQRQGDRLSSTYATQACLNQLQDTAAISALDCKNNCEEATFALGPSATHSGVSLLVACGTVELSSIDSITTEGKSAMVKYTRRRTMDSVALSKLDQCKFVMPSQGWESVQATFKRDDAGKWQLSD